MGFGPSPLENLAVTALPESTFWNGKRVLLTGHSGFKGSWLSFWLARLGAKVAGVSLPPVSEPNLFHLARIGELMESRWVDVREESAIARIFEESQPEVVFHLAAQSLVRLGYDDPVGTFTTNVVGTLNILEAARRIPSVKSVVVVTTDKVYLNLEENRPFQESDSLGGRDPYGASKAASEMVVSCYRDSFYRTADIGLAAARAGNVIGGGDWSTDRILPDAVRAWGRGETLLVRNPKATRPWQHVLEPLAAYLRLAEFLWSTPEASADFNFGPDSSANASVEDVVLQARDAFGGGEVQWGAQPDHKYEAHTLSLDNSKARELLGVRPHWDLPGSISRTMSWYRRQLDGEDARKLCEEDLEAFCSLK